MIMSWDQHTGQNHNIKICNKSFESVTKFKYLGTTQTKITFVRKLRTD
jgi:hypothetical protein